MQLVALTAASGVVKVVCGVGVRSVGVDREKFIKMAETKEDEMLQFVTIIKEHGMPLLCKSKKPQDRNKKENATLAVINAYGCKGVVITKEQIRKKISNIEQKLKHQLDMKKTGGGPPPVLKPFQEMWLEMVNESNDEPNPKLHPLSYGISAGTSKRHGSTSSPTEEESIDMAPLTCGISVGTSATSHHPDSRAPSPAFADEPGPSTSSGIQQMKPPPSSVKNKRSCDALDMNFSVETKETEVLSTRQLQRLVLLEQLHYLREKRAKISSTPASNMPTESVNVLGDITALATTRELRFVRDTETGKEYEEL